MDNMENNEIIPEQINKLVEDLNKKLDSIVKESEIEEKTVEVVATVSTAITVEMKTITKKAASVMITNSSLTDEQKALALSIYESVKNVIQEFIYDPNLNTTIKITKTISQVVKQLENTKLNGKIPTGEDKKAVAIELGRILIKDVTPDDKGEAEILMVYDIMAEPTLEAMIEVSKVVNVVVQEIATQCCPGLLKIFKNKY